MKYSYLAIYSLSAKTVELEKKIKDGAVVKDEVRIAEGDEYLAEIPLIDYDYARFEGECRCRGGDWKVYKGDVPFAWELVTHKEEVKE